MKMKMLVNIAVAVVLSVFGQSELRGQTETVAVGLPDKPPEVVALTPYPNTFNAPMTVGYGGGVQQASREPRQVLVVDTAGGDSKSREALEEDLPIMWHVLNNSIGKAVGAAPNSNRAMGIDVMFAPGSSNIRSLYLDGYGVLFLLNVDFPLLPPPKSPEVQKENPRADSAWEEARQEVYGRPVSDGRVMASPAAAYDEEKVNALKSALLESLKSASNIRGLRSDDTITVCVMGWASGAGVKQVKELEKTGALGSQQQYEWDQALTKAANGTDQVNPSTGEIVTAMHRAILNVSVKKADVDSFANGKLSPDEFRKVAKVIVYASQSGGLDLGQIHGQGQPGWMRY